MRATTSWRGIRSQAAAFPSAMRTMTWRHSPSNSLRRMRWSLENPRRVHRPCSREHGAVRGRGLTRDKVMMNRRRTIPIRAMDCATMPPIHRSTMCRQSIPYSARITTTAITIHHCITPIHRQTYQASIIPQGFQQGRQRSRVTAPLFRHRWLHQRFRLIVPPLRHIPHLPPSDSTDDSAPCHRVNRGLGDQIIAEVHHSNQTN